MSESNERSGNDKLIPNDFTDWHFCHTTSELSDVVAPAWGPYVGKELRNAFPGAQVTFGAYEDWGGELDIVAPEGTRPEVVTAVRSAAEKAIQNLANRIVTGQAP